VFQQLSPSFGFHVKLNAWLQQISPIFGFHVQRNAWLNCQSGLEAGIINVKLSMPANASNPAGVQHTHLEQGLRIRIHLIRIQHFRLSTNPDPGFLWLKIEKNFN
jgi:hypothetical protein